MNWYKIAQLSTWIPTKTEEGLWITNTGEIVDTEDWAIAHADSYLQYLENKRPKEFREVKDVLLSEHGKFDDDGNCLEDSLYEINESYVSGLAERRGWIKVLSLLSKNNQRHLEASMNEPSPQALIALLKLAHGGNYDVLFINGELCTDIMSFRNKARQYASSSNWYKKSQAKAHYVGNCIDLFDNKGECKINIFNNVSDFSNKENKIREQIQEGREILMSSEDFLSIVDATVLEGKNLQDDFEFYFYPETEFSPQIYVAYDIEADTHYFFI